MGGWRGSCPRNSPSIPVRSAGSSPSIPVGSAGTTSPSIPVGSADSSSPSIPVGSAGSSSPSIPVGSAGSSSPSIKVGSAGSSNHQGAVNSPIEEVGRDQNSKLYIWRCQSVHIPASVGRCPLLGVSVNRDSTVCLIHSSSYRIASAYISRV